MKSSWDKLALTAAVFTALVGMALLASKIPALQTLYLQVSGSLLSLLGLNHAHDLIGQKTDDGVDNSVAPVVPAAPPAPVSTGPTPEQILTAIMPAAHPALIAVHAPAMAAAASKWDISTPQRLAMFLANIALECDQLRELQEDWGPSEAQLKYEPPSHVATELGNTEAGDGKRFMGRGCIQITGRDNYSRAGKAIGTDLVANPALAAVPSVAWDTAGWFWETHGLNAVADTGTFTETVRIINGGLTDLGLRVEFYDRAKKILGLPQ
jgi:putative chitinase